MITCGLSFGGSPVRPVCVTAGEAEPESRIQHLGSRIKHPAPSIQDPAFRIQNPASRIQDSTSSIHVLGRPGTPASGEAAWGTRLFEAVCTGSLLVCWAGWGAGMFHRQWQSCHCCGRPWSVSAQKVSHHTGGGEFGLKRMGPPWISLMHTSHCSRMVMSWLWWL